MAMLEATQRASRFARRRLARSPAERDRENRRAHSFGDVGEVNENRWSRHTYGAYAADESALEWNPNPFAVVVLAHLQSLRTAHDAESRRVSQVRLIQGAS